MKLNFCTLFDSNYLSRGLLMYQSLQKQCKDFHLYVFAFDDNCYNFLKKENYPNLTPIPLKDFEDKKILNVKPTRTATEYCWTCTASTILYSIEKFKLDNCTYVDADLYFYSNPAILVEEMGDKSVLITPHRYTPVYDQSKESGKYCVQFVTFKNDPKGLAVLRYWRNACIDWCYARIEDGKFGDQKYLDDWLVRFEGVHELQHLGGGIAPWNLQQYSFSNENNMLYGRELKSNKKFEVVFFHFHGVKFFKNDIVSLSGPLYELNRGTKKIFYFPYINALNKIKKDIQQKMLPVDPNGAQVTTTEKPMSLLQWIKYFFGDIKNHPDSFAPALFKDRSLHHHFYRNSRF